MTDIQRLSAAECYPYNLAIVLANTNKMVEAKTYANDCDLSRLQRIITDLINCDDPNTSFPVRLTQMYFYNGMTLNELQDAYKQLDFIAAEEIKKGIKIIKVYEDIYLRSKDEIVQNSRATALKYKKRCEEYEKIFKQLEESLKSINKS